MLNLFDPYELRARMAPSALLCSPLLLLVLPLLEAWPVGLLPAGIGIGTVLILIYAASLVVRSIGKAREPQIWERWGGAPSTIIMQEDDATFSADIKSLIRNAVSRRFNISMDSGNHSHSTRVADAFSLVRQRIRQLDPGGLWVKHNAEYGFLRNFAASLPKVGAGMAAVSAVGAGALWVTTNDAVAAGSAIGAVLLVPLTMWLPGKLESALRTAAFRYAESAWLSFLHLESSGQ